MKIDIQPWKRIETRKLFEHIRFTIVEDTVILPSGKHANWWRFTNRPDIVTIICMNEQSEILVDYQYNNAPQCIIAEFPGGMMDEGEDEIDTARRELIEETGFYPHNLEKIGSFFTQHRHATIKCHVFFATNLEVKQASPDDEEFIQTKWLNVTAVERYIADGTFENITMLAAWSIFRATILTKL